MNDWQTKVKEFHERFGGTVGTTPELQDVPLRLNLIREEYWETICAVSERNLPATIDGLADLIYVIIGAAVAWGVDLDPVFAAVHAANMCKQGGDVRADGKICKPPGWIPPDVAGELKKQGWAG